MPKISADEFLRDLQSEIGPDLSKSFQNRINGMTPAIFWRVMDGKTPLQFAEEYNASSSFRQQKLAELPSNFHRTLLAKSVGEFSVQVGYILSDLTMHDLEKKVRTKDWNRVANKNDADAHLTVDHKQHLEKFPAPPDYTKILSSDTVHKPHKLDENGISAKMVHQSGENDIYMAKPYHKKIESATKRWVKNPILGWATMATKALFDAGGIGHLSEDVSTHEHDGVPLTVRKFAPDHKSIGQLISSRGSRNIEAHVDPLDVHKIAVMDYLANNLDRHNGNLMIGNWTTPRGTNPLLAIDHERNFQYHRKLGDLHWKQSDTHDISKETPMSYLHSSSLDHALRPNRNAWHSHEDLVDWWKQHGQKIRDEMDAQVQSIKDESVRKHVRDNFHDRWHKMNDWASNVSADPNDDAMWQESSLDDRFSPGRIIPQERPCVTAKQLRSLPKNKKDALFAISDIVNKKGRLTMNQRSLLHGAIKKIMTDMTPEEAGDIFRSVVENPHMSTKVIRSEPDIDVKNQMLRHFSERNWSAGEPTFKYEHMKSIADAIDQLPDDKKEILSHWGEHFRRLMNERKAA